MSMLATSHTGPLRMSGLVRAGWTIRRGPDLFSVTRDRLTLHSFGILSFTPEEVVSIEHQDSHWLDGGVRIVHGRADCPRTISFFCHGGSAEVFRVVSLAGFVPRGTQPAGRTRLAVAIRVLVAGLALQLLISTIFRLLHR